jgi:hypothetical protein
MSEAMVKNSIKGRVALLGQRRAKYIQKGFKKRGDARRVY